MRSLWLLCALLVLFVASCVAPMVDDPLCPPPIADPTCIGGISHDAPPGMP